MLIFFTAQRHTGESVGEGARMEWLFVVEFGLENEFMMPLATGKFDPFVGIIGALSELLPGELALFQILWQPVRNRWAESIVDSVTNGYGGSRFSENYPELTSAAAKKVARPLFAAVVRLVIRTGERERALQLAYPGLSSALRVFANPQGNELIPLSNDAYEFEDHVQDVLLRQTHRSGMLLSADELTGFVHFTIQCRSFSGLGAPGWEEQSRTIYRPPQGRLIARKQ